LRGHPQKQILENLVGEIPPGLLNGFSKMRGALMSQQRYLDLWDLYHEDHARKQ